MASLFTLFMQTAIISIDITEMSDKTQAEQKVGMTLEKQFCGRSLCGGA